MTAVWSHAGARVLDGSIGDVRMLLVATAPRSTAVLDPELARSLRDWLSAWLAGDDLPPADPCRVRSAVHEQRLALLARDLTGSDATTEAAWAQSALAVIDAACRDPDPARDPAARRPAVALTTLNGDDMTRYRKKPVEIEALQWTGANTAEVSDFMGGSPAFESPDGGEVAVRLTTVHGDTAWARPGDWIIPEASPGRFYPCAADVFTATYEPVG